MIKSTSGILTGVRLGILVCLGYLVWNSASSMCLVNVPILDANVQVHEDHYVLLSNDELTKNADILRHLAMATKEEIEDLVASNPMIQQNLLRKVEDVVRIKQESGNLNSVGDHKSIEIVDDHDHEIVEDFDDYDDDPAGREQLQSIKMKLKNKAAKLLKIGDGLKRKLAELGHKKLRKFRKLKKKKKKKQIPAHRHQDDDDVEDEADDDGDEIHNNPDNYAAKGASNNGYPAPPVQPGGPPYAAPPAAAAGAPRFHFNVSTSSKKRRRRKRQLPG